MAILCFQSLNVDLLGFIQVLSYFDSLKNTELEYF